MRRTTNPSPTITGCSLRVETLGNFEGQSRLIITEVENQIYRGSIKVPSKDTEAKSNLPRQNSSSIEKLPRKNSGLCYTLLSLILTYHILSGERFLFATSYWRIHWFSCSTYSNGPVINRQKIGIRHCVHKRHDINNPSAFLLLEIYINFWKSILL